MADGCTDSSFTVHDPTASISLIVGVFIHCELTAHVHTQSDSFYVLEKQ